MQQLRRIGERLVLGEPARIGVAVRADDRQVLDAGIEVARDRPRPLFGGKQQIRIDQCAHGLRVAPPSAELWYESRRNNVNIQK